MLGYRLFSNNEKEAGHRLSYSKTNITKVKGSFLYTERKKYFDFTSAINMGAFGYNNKFTTARLKESLTKNHSYLTSLSQVKNYLNPLYRHYPSLREYDCYPLSDSQLSDWLLENFSHCQIHKEPIEENILTSLMERNNLQSNQNKEKKKNIKWVTDLNYFYQLLDSSNARHTRHTEDMEHTEDTEKTQEPRISSSHKGIILNSFFPHALHYFFSSNADIESKLKFENTEKEDFDFILYRNANSVENYSEVTYGISNCVLLFVKKEASVSESPITKPNNQYLISLDYSRATIKKALNKMYFKKEISEKKSSSQNHSLKKNRFNRQTKPLEQSLQILEKEIDIIKQMKGIEKVEGEGLFYKITLKESLTKHLNLFSPCRFLIKNISIVSDGQRSFYLALPLYLEPNHLKGKLVDGFTALSNLLELTN